MRLEGDEHAGDLEHARAVDEPLYYVAVSAMNTIERTDGDDGTVDVRRQPGLVGEVMILRHR